MTATGNRWGAGPRPEDTSPVSYASTTARTRPRSSRLLSTCDTCVFAVVSLMWRRSAISPFDQSLARHCYTSRSLSASTSSCEEAGLEAQRGRHALEQPARHRWREERVASGDDTYGAHQFVNGRQ